MTNKNQQDEEEERGKILTMKFFLKRKISLFIEIIRVYDGNATFRSGTPRSISIPKQATYTQILVCTK
jgi:hypothetical protein